MSLSFRSLLAAAWLATLGGCFVETPPVEETSPDPECAAGALGCACLEASTCDAGLSCLTEAGVCVPEGCEPGSPQCGCDEGSCSGGWVCVDKVCSPPSSTGDDGGSDVSDDDGADTGDTGTDDGADTGGSSDDVGDSGETGMSDTDSGEDSATSGDTGEPMACDAEPSCVACFACAADDAPSCGSEADACDGIAGCSAVAQCLLTCSVDGLCLDDCCSGQSNEAVTAAYALEDCRRDHCVAACGTYSNAPCG